jgi:hypothetical protein
VRRSRAAMESRRARRGGTSQQDGQRNDGYKSLRHKSSDTPRDQCCDPPTGPESVDAGNNSPHQLVPVRLSDPAYVCSRLEAKAQHPSRRGHRIRQHARQACVPNRYRDTQAHVLTHRCSTLTLLQRYVPRRKGENTCPPGGGEQAEGSTDHLELTLSAIVQ